MFVREQIQAHMYGPSILFEMELYSTPLCFVLQALQLLGSPLIPMSYECWEVESYEWRIDIPPMHLTCPHACTAVLLIKSSLALYG